MADRNSSSAPIVEGIAVEATLSTDLNALISQLKAVVPDCDWKSMPGLDNWVRVRYANPVPLDQGNEDLRQVRAQSGVVSAELLLTLRLPAATEREAGQQFKLWGAINRGRRKQIEEASKADPLWYRKQLGVDSAWVAWKAKHGNTNLPGHGIIVAHPDTGYTNHPALLGHLHNTGKNFVARDADGNPTDDAKDNLDEQDLLEFPGHGTSTGSVITAAKNLTGQETSVAPGARLLPLRVSDSVVHINFNNVSDALAEAVAQNAHVVSMSLGGPVGSKLLNRRVWQALEAGIIIVSAAGNFAPTVVFPALVPGVIACSASNVLNAPWRFSGMGEAVAITAPGELVWNARASLDLSDHSLKYGYSAGNGTSFATANIAGLAALWLSYHGRDALLQDYPGSLLSFAFRRCLEDAATPLERVKWGFGQGVPDAEKLLTADLPNVDDVRKRRDEALAKTADSVISLPVNSWWSILTLPTLAESPETASPPPPPSPALLEAFLTELLGDRSAQERELDLAELGTLAAMDAGLSHALARVAAGERRRVSASALRRYLLREAAGVPLVALSKPLRTVLERRQSAAGREYLKERPEIPEAPAPPQPAREKKAAESEKPARPFEVEAPRIRRLKAYAFDPSLAIRTDTVLVNEIIVPVHFEKDLTPGPRGEYLEVIDVDPASDCLYAPVDLNHPWILAEDGLPRSESNPMFHQQMVYAVGMKTIGHFEEALGRPIFWSPLRPWNTESGDKERAGNPRRNSDIFVRRLRLYPHALREQNAYYSPQKRAILFGYFPADSTDPGGTYPGGMVFTCLAHDIIAHEMTHAILDGMHVYFTEDTNADVFAFHEAFADIVALFQRFSYPTLLKDQIARTRGRLDSGTLLSQLALQFGQATGRRSALRDALGYVVSKKPTVAGAEKDLAFDEETTLEWRRFKANPTDLAREMEPHARGAYLVAAVFDAYLSIYEDRIRDLRRIATGGTGILPEGDLHPDLVNRMADEAARSARHVLRMCIRAMDYTPPVDITFGEFLRALITADYDLVPEDPRRYRVAFIEAFRKWGIYPREVRTLSEETLRWLPPKLDKGGKASLFSAGKELPVRAEALEAAKNLLINWKPGTSRERIFDLALAAQKNLNLYLKAVKADSVIQKIFEGIDLFVAEESFRFNVANMRPARRVGPNGEFLTELVVEIVQTQKGTEPGLLYPFRGGITLIASMEGDDFTVRYAIRKRAYNTSREAEQREYLLGASGGSGEAAEYSSVNLPENWREIRAFDREGMRASSCGCREKAIRDKQAKKEPFALLHRP